MAEKLKTYGNDAGKLYFEKLSKASKEHSYAWFDA